MGKEETSCFPKAGVNRTHVRGGGTEEKNRGRNRASRDRNIKGCRRCEIGEKKGGTKKEPRLKGENHQSRCLLGSRGPTQKRAASALTLAPVVKGGKQGSRQGGRPNDGRALGVI